MLPDHLARRGRTLTRERAEAIALQGVAFIAGDPETLMALLRVTGVAPDDLKTRLQDPAFLSGVLDFLLEYEPRLLKFCAAHDLDPALPAAARAVLDPPGQSDHI